MMKIPFSKPVLTGDELSNIMQAYSNKMLSGNGDFTKRCQRWFEECFNVRKALLTHSCTAALEFSSLLSNLKPGDEVILPSYTFVSTANAFVLRGAVPVFVEIRQDTLNIDETLIEAAITEKTKAIVPVHYGGVGAEMDTIMEIAKRHNLIVIEDAAQGFYAQYKGRELGTIGDFGTLSFHETKNITNGEGGVLYINRPEYIDRSEIVWEKGTNRSQFIRGEVDKYTWVDIGSSFLPGEISAAFLFAQLNHGKEITETRLQLWDIYKKSLNSLEQAGKIMLPKIPEHCQHNAHLFYFLCETADQRNQLLKFLRERGIGAVFHYIPLHNSPAGKRFGRTNGDLSQTINIADRLIRIPLFSSLLDDEQTYIIEQIHLFFSK